VQASAPAQAIFHEGPSEHSPSGLKSPPLGETNQPAIARRTFGAHTLALETLLPLIRVVPAAGSTGLDLVDDVLVLYPTSVVIFRKKRSIWLPSVIVTPKDLL